MTKLQDMTVYSYHTFIFPFLWNDSGRVKLETFRKCLHPAWQTDYVDNSQDFISWRYAQYQYFNRAARNAIFTERDDKSPVVRNYRFNLDSVKKKAPKGKAPDGKGTYQNQVLFVIDKDIFKYDADQKKDVVDRHFNAELVVNAIRLKLYSTGVGMLVFELENYEQVDEKSLNLINEYGRRIFMPYVGTQNRCGLCADRIILRCNEQDVLSSSISGVELKHDSDIRLPSLITWFFSNDGWSIIGKPAYTREKKQFYIEPIIDDRMFVACFWTNKEFVDEMSQWQDGAYSYLRDASEYVPYKEKNRARKLYEVMFVDGDGLSCHSRQMLKEMLEKHIYHRWLENAQEKKGVEEKSGTITGITEYSLVSVSSCGWLANPFLTMYIEMAILVLAQRASLLSFERLISDCSRGRGRVRNIQKEYVLFQSRLLLQEVTPQQQGIELYDMMLENCFINKEQHDIESQIDALFSMENNLNERYDNILLAVLAAMGIFEVADILLPSNLSHPIGAVMFALALGIFFLIRCHRLR